MAINDPLRIGKIHLEEELIIDSAYPDRVVATRPQFEDALPLTIAQEKESKQLAPECQTS